MQKAFWGILIVIVIGLLLFVSGGRYNWFRRSDADDGPGIMKDVEFLPGDSTFISADTRGNFCIWNVESGELIRCFGRGTRANTPIAVSPDGAMLACQYGVPEIWDVESGELLIQFNVNDRTNCLAFSEDGQWLLTGGNDHFVHVWALNGEEQLRLPHESNVHDVAVVPGSEWVITASGEFTGREFHDTAVRCWNINTGELEFRVATERPVSAIAASSTGELVAIGDGAGKIQVLETDSWEVVTQFEMRRNVDVSALVFSPDEQFLISGAGERAAWTGRQMIQVWRMESGEQLDHYLDETSVVWGLDISDDGQRLITAHGYPKSREDWDGGLIPYFVDCNVRIWDTSTSDLIRVCDAIE